MCCIMPDMKLVLPASFTETAVVLYRNGGEASPTLIKHTHKDNRYKKVLLNKANEIHSTETNIKFPFIKGVSLLNGLFRSN